MHLEQPMVLPRTGQIKLQCASVEISDLIPNFYNGNPYGLSFDNTRCRVGNDVDGYVTIQLEMGRYSAQQITAAVNATINSLGWWTSSTDPGFTITGNDVIQKHVISIDSTKLAPAHGTQFYFDLSTATTNNSMMYYSLGYTSTTSLIVDGVYESPNLPQMETQGTACVIECDLAEMRRYSEGFKKVLAEVPFAGKTTFSNSVWPQGAQISPDMIYGGPRTFNLVTIKIKTRSSAPMLFMGGIMSISIRFL
jgi:hypothetical protein